MKLGTSGFVGERLKEAREARGLNITALADIIGISKQAISQYEKDIQNPRPEIMEQLSIKLNLPKHFFITKPGYPKTNTVFYRSMSAATKGARVRAEWKLAWLKEIEQYLKGYLVLPEVNFPDFDIPKDPIKLSSENIEILATETRRYWGMGDGIISNVIALLESKGAIISRIDLEAETLDAFSEWSENNVPYVVLSSKKDCAVRSRFDAAHELAHLLLHRYINKAQFCTPSEFSLIEKQAHRFSSAFLLPAETFLKDFSAPTLDSFWVLKEKWRVSIGTMLKRCEDLGIIKEDFARKLWISYNRRGWAKKEPLDDKIPVETPGLLRKCFEVLISEGVQQIDDIVSSIPYARTDIEELLYLPEGHLKEPASLEVVPLLRNPNTDASCKILKFERKN
jgi:Zn-dependent peptidase ImmA (M78 family)/DNA-binding XRE family transcriptional regulator